MRIRYLTTFILTVFLCQACGPQTTRPDHLPSNPESRAAQLIDQGNYRRAASLYRQLAESNPDQSSRYLLEAAAALITANDHDAASTLLESVQPAAGDDTGYSRKIILQAQIDMRQNRPASALSGLQQLKLERIPPDLLVEYLETRATAFELSGNYGSAARERLALNQFLTRQEKQQTNNQLIWQNLNRLGSDRLEYLRRSASPELIGWIELAGLYQDLLLKPVQLNQAVAMWSRQYPDHPANSITAAILNTSNNSFQPAHIALLLPFSGQYQLVSETIRDGFLAAWYESEEYKPRISIYSANSLDVVPVYNEAVADGAEFVVGPLEQEAVGNLMNSGRLPVKVLALNQYQIHEQNLIPGPGDAAIPEVVQFGLIPEDEARQLAADTYARGYRKALVISRDDDYDRRLFETFHRHWTESGGKVMSHIVYDPATRDFSTPVQELLNVSGSDRRARRLQQRLSRAIKSESRLRQDADMILMIARPGEARQLMPQFRFYRAGNIPVFAPSRIFSGIANPQLDQDLNDVAFIDAPWVLRQQDDHSGLQRTVNRLWQADRSRYNRFYAFGIDAYRMIPHLGRLTAQPTVPYHGQTGDLYLEQTGKIDRNLIWARFENGRPVIEEPGMTR